MYYEEIDVINIFKSVKGQRPIKKLPKLSPDSLSQLQEITNAFNTKWSNIEPSNYFKCGNMIWKNFTYAKFMDAEILIRYIRMDKRIKRSGVFKKNIIDSFIYLKAKGYKSLQEYVNYDNDKEYEYIHLCVHDYFHNSIDKVVMAYMMFNLFKINEIERSFTGYIWDNEKNMRAKVKRYRRYIQKLEKEYLI